MEENPVADLVIDPTTGERDDLPGTKATALPSQAKIHQRGMGSGGEGIALSAVDPVVGMVVVVTVKLRQERFQHFHRKAEANGWNQMIYGASSL